MVIITILLTTRQLIRLGQESDPTQISSVSTLNQTPVSSNAASTNPQTLITTQTPKSIRENTIVASEVGKLPVFDADTSSYYNDHYKPGGAIDEHTVSSWMSTLGDTQGAWLELHLPEPKTVIQIRIFMKVEAPYTGSQIRDATLTFPDSDNQTVRFPFESGWQAVELLTPVTTESVKLIVEDIYPGHTFEKAVEVKEIELYGY